MKDARRGTDRYTPLVMATLGCTGPAHRREVSRHVTWRALGAAISFIACGGADASFTIGHAADFAGGPVKASVLGIYRDGRLSAGTWLAFAPRLSAAWRGLDCGAGYGEELKATNGDAFSAIDAEGNSGDGGDALLEMVAPAAEGEFILVFHVYGEQATSGHVPEGPRRVLVAHGGGPMASDAAPRASAPKRSGFEISGSFYSPLQHQTVAFLMMEHPGPRLEDAFEGFAAKFELAFPTASCAGWQWGSVRAVHEVDALGLPLRRFRLVRGTP
jgi:hypothetical protein